MNCSLGTMPRISFVLCTHNRRAVVLETLSQIERCGLDGGEYEIHVVDDASTDGTGEAIAERFPGVRLIRQKRNLGPVSKNAALPFVRGEYVVFLDDDSYPLPGSVARMMEHFGAEPGLGAAVFRVSLPEGGEESSAYPNVFIGCGTGFRRSALEEVGGLPDDFFMQAEEYDLSLRLMEGGWQVRRFEDLRVRHLKTAVSRVSGRTVALDVRNNLVLIGRYFPRRWVLPFAVDWARRYHMLAESNGQERAFWRGLAWGIWRWVFGLKRRPVSYGVFESFARLGETYRRMRRAQARLGLHRVVFVDLGKNALAYWLAARRCGLEVVAVADPKLAGGGRKYHGIPILRDEEARRRQFDAAIIANLSPAHAWKRLEEWRKETWKPVVDLFAPAAQERSCGKAA